MENSSHEYDDDELMKRNMDEKKETALSIDPNKGQHVGVLKPYAGMGKDDLLKFSQTPFWNRMRCACLVIFWAAWLSLLVAVIVLTIVLPRCSAPPSRNWWQHTAIYDVYVPSFYDSDGDGRGDIKGVQEKLDYIQGLKIETIALSAIYDSDSDPTTGDLGSDVTNHMDVDFRVGKLEDMKELVDEVHKRGMKILLDFIPNHTSKKHHWFTESKSNRSSANPYWNYYIWADCTEEMPPNNWLSVYGNSSWSWDPERRQCYFHNFLSHSPELNLRSSSVLNELDIVLSFWLRDVGVDGFRVRSASFLFEDSDLKMEPLINGCNDESSYECLDHIYTRNQKENVVQITRWRELLDEESADNEYRILMVESVDPVNETVAFYGGNLLNGAHLPINWQLSTVDGRQCDGHCILDKVNDWLNAMPGGATANWQSASSELGRLDTGGEVFLQSAVTMLAMTLPGVPLIYYGEELGMINGNISLISQDPIGHINPSWSRDRFRTPMQWNDGFNAGFTNSSTPHLPVNGDYSTVNVKAQIQSDKSVLGLFQTLAGLHQEEETFRIGDLNFLSTDDQIISYVRQFNGRDSYLIAINFGYTESTNDYGRSGLVPDTADVVMVTSGAEPRPGDTVSLTELKLSPRQGIILKWAYTR